MFKVCFCIVLAGLGLSAQTAKPPTSTDKQSDNQAVAKVTPNLMMTMVNGGVPGDVWSGKLADTMMELAVKERQPKWTEVADFTASVKGVMAGKTVNTAQEGVLARCIVDVLRGTGVSNYTLAQQAREALTALRVDEAKTELIVRRFIAVGEAVRGPDDMSLRPIRSVQQK